MTTLTKSDMIKALVAEGKVPEFRTDSDSDATLAKKMFQALTSDKVKELYNERIKPSPTKALEEVTKKAKKVAEKKQPEVAAAPKKETKKAAPKKEEPKAGEVKAEVILGKYDPMNVPEAKIRNKKGEVIGIHPLYEAVEVGKITIPKAWIYEELKLAGFEKIETGRAVRAGKETTLVYIAATNTLREMAGTKVLASTKCLCQFMVHGFIKKRI